MLFRYQQCLLFIFVHHNNRHSYALTLEVYHVSNSTNTLQFEASSPSYLALNISITLCYLPIYNKAPYWVSWYAQPIIKYARLTFTTNNPYSLLFVIHMYILFVFHLTELHIKFHLETKRDLQQKEPSNLDSLRNPNKHSPTGPNSETIITKNY